MVLRERSRGWRRRGVVALAAAGLALAVLGLLRACWPEDVPASAGPGAAGPAADGSVASARPPGAQRSAFWAMAEDAESAVLQAHYRAAGVPTAEPPALSGTGAAEWAARRLDARWCAEDGARHEAASGELMHKLSQSGKVFGAEQMEQMEQWKRTQSLGQTLRATLNRWEGLLLQRGDALSLAVREQLRLRFPQDPSSRAQALANLHELARRSGQPAVMAMALASPCGDAPGCRDFDASVWVGREPGNLQAWLRQMEQMQGRRAAADPAVCAELRPLLAGAAASSFSHSHTAEGVMVLASLPQQLQPGLRNAAEQEILSTLLFSEFGPMPGALFRRCKQAADSNPGLDGAGDGAGLRPQCAAVAERLWQQGENMVQRGLAHKLGLILEPGRPDWPQRAREFEALQRWQSRDDHPLMVGLSEHASGCDPGQALRRHVLGVATQGEWAYLQAERAAAGLPGGRASAAGRAASEAPPALRAGS